MTSGSRAAAAMKRERAADLPAPGSPPSSRLRSGRPIETGLPSSSIPREIGSHSEPGRPGPRRGGHRQRVAQDDREVGQRGVGGVADDPDLAGPDGGGQRLGGLPRSARR